MHCQRLAFAVAAILTLSAPLAAQPVSSRTPELSRAELRHDGRTRTYLHWAPTRREGRKLPALFVLHGGGGSASGIARQTGFADVARQHGLLVVFPNAVDKQWNDGRPVGDNFRAVDVSGVDDVGFVSALLRRAVAKHGADPRRLYVVGLSNGGMMSYRVAIELGDRIAGAAVIVANMPRHQLGQTPKAPVPVLIMNGTRDPLMPYRGGVSAFARRMGKKGHPGVASTDETVKFWVTHNGLAPKSKVTRLPDRDVKDDSTVVISAFDGAAPVVLYSVRGGGHCLPGGPGSPRRLLGAKNGDIDGRREIWRFLARHSR